MAERRGRRGRGHGAQPSSTRLLADQLAAATGSCGAAGRRTRVEFEVIELRELAHDLTDHLLTGFPSTALGGPPWSSCVGADGLIVVTPVFSASYSGLFKLFFDVLEADAAGR